MKMVRRSKALLVLFLASTICGCQSGLYKISTSEDGKELDSKMSYSEVSTLNTEVDFDSSRMPVEIVHGQEKRMPDEGGVSGVLWLFTLGIFPMVQTEYVAQDITVKTPIGVKSGTWRVDAKRWIGWVPLFIGYPSLADERDTDAKLPNLQMERKAKDKLVDSLAREFSYDAYVSFANNKNKERKSECDHIAEVRQKINGLMAENKYDAAEQLRLREAVNRAGTWACDAAVWQELAETIAEKREEHRVAVERVREQQRVQNKKKLLAEMIKEGRFEEVIKACDEEKVDPEKGNPWTEIRNNVFMDIKKSIPTMNDSSRLVSLFSMVDDIPTKDAIIIKLGALNKCSLLGDSTLVKYVTESSSGEGRLSAVAAIGSEKELIVIAKAKYSKAITIAAFKKLSADKLRADVFSATDIDEEFASWYIDAYGTDQELIAIVKLCGEKIGGGIEKMIRERTNSEEVREELNKIEVRRKAAKFKSFDVLFYLFGRLLPEIESVPDPSARAALAECLLDRHMKGHRNEVYVGSDDTTGAGILKFTSFLSTRYCERLFSNITVYGGDGHITVLGGDGHSEEFAVGLFRRMGQKARQDRIKSATDRFNAKDRIHFEGFYIGMSWIDFCVMCAQKGCIAQVETGKEGVSRIVFKRTARYAMFEKEDGEFWSAYLRKYVPSQKKQKSLTDTIGDVLDSGTFDYQEGWDDFLEEYCYIYKSMKYGTRVLFGQKSGTLVLEEYK